MNNLFDSIERRYLEAARHNENVYDYYNTSARADMTIIRNTLEGWFLNYPENEKKELKSRFKKDFYSAFYELFLYELFSKLGYEITIHPNLPSSPKRPDFLICRDGLEIYVEAKVVTNKTDEQEAFERKRNEFYDNLNKLDSGDFLLYVERFDILTKKQPGTKGIIAYIEQELNKINPDMVSKDIKENGIGKLPVIEYNNGDIHVVVKPIPVTPSARKVKKRPIGIYPVETFLGGGEEALRNSIGKKAKKYGKLDKPFIICLNSLDVRMSGKTDVDNAIWGSPALSYPIDSEILENKWKRQADGVFFNKRGVRFKNLTGIFVSEICPHNIPVANYWLYEHPFSENKMDFNKIGLKFNYMHEDHIVDNTGDDIGDILHISKDWLV